MPSINVVSRPSDDVKLYIDAQSPGGHAKGIRESHSTIDYAGASHQRDHSLGLFTLPALDLTTIQ